MTQQSVVDLRGTCLRTLYQDMKSAEEERLDYTARASRIKDNKLSCGNLATLHRKDKDFLQREACEVVIGLCMGDINL